MCNNGLFFSRLVQNYNYLLLINSNQQIGNLITLTQSRDFKLTIKVN